MSDFKKMTDEQLEAYLEKKYGEDYMLWNENDPATQEFFNRLAQGT